MLFNYLYVQLYSTIHINFKKYFIFIILNTKNYVIKYNKLYSNIFIILIIIIIIIIILKNTYNIFVHL